MSRAGSVVDEDGSRTYVVVVAGFVVVGGSDGGGGRVVVVVVVAVVVGGVVVVVAGAGVGAGVGATVVGALVGAAVVGGAVVSGSLDVGRGALDVDSSPSTVVLVVVVDSATVVDVVAEVDVVVDGSLVSAQAASSLAVVLLVDGTVLGAVVDDGAAAPRSVGTTISAPAAARPIRTSGVTGRPDRCCRRRITPPASTASNPMTTSVPTVPPEIGRSQGWASMTGGPSRGGGCGPA